VLVLDTGQEIPVEDAVVLGRNPKSPADVEARPVVVSDEQLSRTHLLVRPRGAEVELTDCGSSNGTTVTHQGVERRVPAGQPTLAGPGDTIQIGQRTATIRRA
jgi:pSer/pThr/pTyr-binding forkhead associated (FHA) protein